MQILKSNILALELCKNDAKIYYRRALALEKLDKVNSAFKDAKEALRLEPANEFVFFDNLKPFTPTPSHAKKIWLMDR